ncbi:MAG TPA: VWA domain-containing protein [Thermoanaerobaculia bacterium]|nr:VWA domain-containing protein [Thermoanaerobaculia bacterium]
MIGFARPGVLALLALPILLAVLRRRARGASAIDVPAAAAARPTPAARMAGLPSLLTGLGLASAIVALAGPRRPVRRAISSAPSTAIAVALDVSGSMAAEDFQPKNRLDVARGVVAEFVRGRPDDPIALLAFAGNARTICPATEDHDALLALLAPLDGSKFADGTAIGNAIATGVARLKALPAKSRVLVLVTDGGNNAGQIDPDTAAGMAAAYGIRVHAVAVGKGGRVPIPVSVRDPETGRVVKRRIEANVEVDEPLLQRIARTTGGRFFRATDARALRDIFSAIDSLEKSPAPRRWEVSWKDLSKAPTLAAAALLLAGIALGSGPLRIETEAA